MRYELITQLDGRAVIYDTLMDTTVAVRAANPADAEAFVNLANLADHIRCQRAASAVAGRAALLAVLKGDL